MERVRGTVNGYYPDFAKYLVKLDDGRVAYFTGGGPFPNGTRVEGELYSSAHTAGVEYSLDNVVKI